MKKKILFLTTRTTHHKYLINYLLSKLNFELKVFNQKKTLKPSFKTFDKSFLIKQKNYEINRLNKKKLNSKYPYTSFLNINSTKCIRSAKKFNPDLIIVFGTDKLNSSWIKCFKNKLFNVHRGDIHKFRGIDSEYWAIYHNLYESIAVTIHKIEKKLDTGKIYKLVRINLKKGIKIHQLRIKMTLIAAKILKELILNKKIKYKKNFNGRYYSFMPLRLRNLCEKKFNKKFK